MAQNIRVHCPIEEPQSLILSAIARFSLLPSFLPREKHVGINIIGHVFQNILLFSQSIQAAVENLKMIPKAVKSKQTILNWLYWIGALHPCTILTRAGVVGSGYFQEDEGFEKEPNLLTYSVFMVDSQNLTATLYNKIKNILNTSNSEVILKIKIQSLDDEAFKHPLLKDRLAALKENAVLQL
ncbi:MAG: hypothetical protein ACMUJM_22935 [bacterium]